METWEAWKHGVMEARDQKNALRPKRARPLFFVAHCPLGPFMAISLVL